MTLQQTCRLSSGTSNAINVMFPYSQQREGFEVIDALGHPKSLELCELHVFYLDLLRSEEIHNGRQSTARNS